MRLKQTVGVLVAILALAVATSSAQAAAKGKKAKKAHAIHGVVTSVQKDNGKDSGTITVKYGGHKAKNGKPAKEPTEKAFIVTDVTKFQEMSGKKPVQEVKATTFGAVKSGAHVSMEVEGDKALVVNMHHHHKKKKV